MEPPLAAPIEKSVPIAVNAIVCALPAASSVIVTLAGRFPVAVGLKVTLIVQFAAAETLAPQVFVSEKSPLFAPAIAMPVMPNVELPLFVSVTFCRALAVVTN